MIVGFEIFIMFPLMLFFLGSTFLSLVIEYCFFVPAALNHAVEGAGDLVTRLLDPQRQGWTPQGATLAFVVGMVLATAGWMAQVLVAAVLTLGNLLFAPVDMVVGVYRRCVSRARVRS